MYVRFQVLTAASMTFRFVFWAVHPRRQILTGIMYVEEFKGKSLRLLYRPTSLRFKPLRYIPFLHSLHILYSFFFL
jgi:hypothetical protein